MLVAVQCLLVHRLQLEHLGAAGVAKEVADHGLLGYGAHPHAVCRLEIEIRRFNFPSVYAAVVESDLQYGVAPRGKRHAGEHQGQTLLRKRLIVETAGAELDDLGRAGKRSNEKHGEC